LVSVCLLGKLACERLLGSSLQNAILDDRDYFNGKFSIFFSKEIKITIILTRSAFRNMFIIKNKIKIKMIWFTFTT
jgi:hypothetical protein